MKALIFILLFSIIYPYSSLAQSSCDYKVEILIDGYEFESKEFKWRMRATKIEGKSTNMTGTAEIEDSSGKTIKSYKPWTSDSISKQKTSSEYSPNLKPGDYKITAEINVECDDANKDNNVDSKKIKIKGEDAVKSEKSESEDIKTNEVKNIKTTADKTNNEETAQTNQNTIKTKTKKSASIEETDNVIQSTNKNNQKNQELQPTTAYAVKEPKIIYESSNEKAKGWIMIFLLTLSVLLNIILIWKR